MRLVHGADIPFNDTGLKHRQNAPVFKFLLLGQEDTPSNYFLTIGRQQSFYSPRHHHNFEQFRYAYRGDISLGEGQDKILHEGELAYFPEGAFYGPQDDGDDQKDVLVLQFGGPNGQGFLSFAQLKSIQNEIMEKGLGKFEGGKFHPKDEGEAPKDGYEALWEYKNGRTLEYPRPKYRHPILMNPDHFSWRLAEEASNVLIKYLGVFSDGSVAAKIISLGIGGRLKVPSKKAIQVFFVLKGVGEVEGQSWKEESAFELLPHEEADFSSYNGMEILHLTMASLS